MPLSNKTIAVIGGGNVGTILAQSILGAPDNDNVKVVIAARDVAKTTASLEKKNLQHLTVQPMADAIAEAEILILATPGAHTDEQAEKLAASLGNVEGKTVIDATNPLTPFDEGFEVRWAQGTSGGEMLDRLLPDSTKVYKCFNSMGADLMARPRSTQGNNQMFYAGPDSDIDDVVRAVGFSQPRRLGPIRYARNLEAMAEMWIHCSATVLPGAQIGGDWTFAMIDK